MKIIVNKKYYKNLGNKRKKVYKKLAKGKITKYVVTQYLLHNRQAPIGAEQCFMRTFYIDFKLAKLSKKDIKRIHLLHSLLEYKYNEYKIRLNLELMTREDIKAARNKYNRSIREFDEEEAVRNVWRGFAWLI